MSNFNSKNNYYFSTDMNVKPRSLPIIIGCFILDRFDLIEDVTTLCPVHMMKFFLDE